MATKKGNRREREKFGVIAMRKKCMELRWKGGIPRSTEMPRDTRIKGKNGTSGKSWSQSTMREWEEEGRRKERGGEVTLLFIPKIPATRSKGRVKADTSATIHSELQVNGERKREVTEIRAIPSAPSQLLHLSLLFRSLLIKFCCILQLFELSRLL